MSDAGVFSTSEITSDQRVVTNQLNQKEVRKIAALNWGSSYHITMEVYREGRVVSASHLYPNTREEVEEQWKWAKNWLKDENNAPRLIEGLHRPNRKEEASRTERAKQGEKSEATAGAGNGE
jgi:hypothetical protein